MRQIAVEPADLNRFRGLVACLFGLQFDHGKDEQLTDALRQRMDATHRAGPAEYLCQFDFGLEPPPEELRQLAALLTVPETYFFRDTDQFRALTEAALPERIRVRSQERRLRLLSAGCASGEEAYSLAILLRERFPELRSWEVEILGVDLNPAVIAKARKGRYSKWSLRHTPEELREKYFRAEGGDYVLDEAVRPLVQFKEKNLALVNDLTGLLDFDVIFCRNLLMYMAPEAAKLVVGKLTRALAPAGFLFLGFAETLRGLSQDFHLRHTHGAFYSQKRLESERLDTAEPVPSGVDLAHGLAHPASTVAAPLAELVDVAWVDAVRRASQRIDLLSRERASQNRPAPAKSVPSATVELGFAFELLRQERFNEALAVLDGLPEEARGDPDFQLLRAGLLANCGDLEAAEDACLRILATDDLNAAAHYIVALCRERAGDPQGAAGHDRAAIYLDAAFAMPHLHLGRMAKKSADFATARLELEQAGLLLSREDPLRILLFGGGFSRDALVAFSRAELRACGGANGGMS